MVMEMVMAMVSILTGVANWDCDIMIEVSHLMNPIMDDTPKHTEPKTMPDWWKE